jgi:hypothetical protein
MFWKDLKSLDSWYWLAQILMLYEVIGFNGS